MIEIWLNATSSKARRQTGPIHGRERSPEAHGRAIADLMRYVSAAPRHQKKGDLDFPIIKNLAPRLVRKQD